MKNGPYRKLVKVEITKATSRYAVGTVVEMHPATAEMLIIREDAKKTTKPVTKVPLLPSARIKESNA